MMLAASRVRVALLGLTLLLACPLFVDGEAAVLPPATIDANTGQDALDVGASIGNRRAWAAFVQKPQGDQRLYVAYAEEGAFKAPFFADRGNAVTAASLGGNGAGDAVVAFTEQVGGKGILFARRLSGGQAGPVGQISSFQNAVIPSPLTGLHHARIVALNDSGAAAVCYLEADGDNIYVGLLAPDAAAWTFLGPLKSTRCDDIAIDARGNVIVVSQDENNDLVADRIVNGVLHSEVIDAAGMDEPSLALTPGGTALAFARIDANGDFAAAAWRKADITKDGAWEKLGAVDVGARAAGENTEYPRAALNAGGKGVVSFRVNNPTANTARIHYAIVDAAKTAGALAAPQKLADVKVGHDAIPNVDDAGNPIIGHQATGASGALLPFVHVFKQGAPGPARPLVPESSEDFALLNVPSFVADASGDFLALLRRYDGNAVRVVAVFGDFIPPTVKPVAAPKRPRLGNLVVLTAKAADSFASLPANAVSWQFPPRSVQGSPRRGGARVSVRFLRRGRVRVDVSAVDRAGNRTAMTTTVVVAPARPLLRVHRATVTGRRFVARLRVTLRLQHGKQASRIAAPRADKRGNFRYRLGARPAGRYVLVACQLGCRVKARTMLRVR